MEHETFKTIMDGSFFENKRKEQIGLPLYMRNNKKNEKRTTELNAFEKFRMVPSSPRITEMHVIRPFYKEII